MIWISAPKEAPTEVHVSVVDHECIEVDWRGVSTDQTEEPLQGYKVSFAVKEFANGSSIGNRAVSAPTINITVLFQLTFELVKGGV